MQNEDPHLGTKTLFNLDVTEISANPLNPRLIFDPEDLEELKKSILKVGILVPVTVYRNTKNYPPTPYILLDGERRWRCAKEIGLETIPANIIDEPSDDTQNILYMFNIHHFRKEWALFPTALKLEVVIDRLGTDQESTLSNFTGVSRSVIRKCKMLLWYPHKYRDVLLEKSARFSIGFFIELYPIAYRMSYEAAYSYPDGTERLVDNMMDKFSRNGVISDVKEFREIRKAMGYFDEVDDTGEFTRRLDEFLERDHVGLEIFSTAEIEDEKNRKNIVKYASYLNASLHDVNPDLISDFYIVDQLEQLNRALTKLLDTIDFN